LAAVGDLLADGDAPDAVGRLSLDFAATLGGRYRGGSERLQSPENMRSWLRASGLYRRPPSVGRRQVIAARKLREAIYRLVHPEREPRRVDLATLNHWATRAPLAPRLAPDGTARWRGAVEAALSTIARDAIDLLTGPLARRIRECARPDCSLLFVDASRPGRRRWCSMERCGNRRRTAAYRRRMREARRLRD
jgi:predicted RNA-binding Zn ribbon-like protein